MTQNSTSRDAINFIDFILTVCTTLIESGAHCERINRNINRIAEAFDFDIEVLYSFTAVTATVIDHQDPRNNRATQTRRVSHHGAQFSLITEASRLSWDFYNQKISMSHLQKQFNTLKNLKRFPIWYVRLLVALACGSLCLIAGGDLINGAVAFIAALLGFIARQDVHKHRFHLMITICSSALVTTLVSGLGVLFQWGAAPEIAVATSVLFLIPGIPLINGIIDFMYGYIPIGLSRIVFAWFILFYIAIGMFISMGLIGITNF